MTFPLNEMYGYSRLCDRLRSSAIIWKQVSLRSSAIYDPRSSAIRDRLRSFAIIWKPALTDETANGGLLVLFRPNDLIAMDYRPKKNFDQISCFPR